MRKWKSRGRRGAGGDKSARCPATWSGPTAPHSQQTAAEMLRVCSQMVSIKSQLLHPSLLRCIFKLHFQQNRSTAAYAVDVYMSIYTMRSSEVVMWPQVAALSHHATSAAIHPPLSSHLFACSSSSFALLFHILIMQVLLLYNRKTSFCMCVYWFLCLCCVCVSSVWHGLSQGPCVWFSSSLLWCWAAPPCHKMLTLISARPLSLNFLKLDFFSLYAQKPWSYALILKMD